MLCPAVHAGSMQECSETPGTMRDSVSLQLLQRPLYRQHEGRTCMRFSHLQRSADVLRSVATLLQPH
jgi:hypothetical protein